jgi:hypothetical protein
LFDQPDDFQGQISNHLFDVAGFPAETLHLFTGGCACGITRKTPLASFQELLRPTVVEALGNTLATAKPGDPFFTVQAFQHDADFIFSRMVIARCTPDVLDNVFGCWLVWPGFLSHLRFL